MHMAMVTPKLVSFFRKMTIDELRDTKTLSQISSTVILMWMLIRVELMTLVCSRRCLIHQ